MTTSIADCLVRKADPLHKYTLYVCQLCQVQVQGHHMFLIHQANCAKVYCRICKKTFHSQQTFNKHLQSNCPPKRHQCQQCRRTYARKSDRDIHAKSCVSGKLYKCDKCSKLFMSKVWLQQHKVSCGVQQVVCKTKPTNTATNNTTSTQESQHTASDDK